MRYAVKAAPAPTGAPLDFIMSDGSIDRMGDVIEPSGWDLTEFKTNPVALFGHDQRQVIGNWENVRVAGGQLRGNLVLGKDDPRTPEVNKIRALVEQGFLRAVSVGFLPVEKEPLTKDADEWWGPFRFLKSKLLECSLVAVPANAHALAVAKSLGLSGDTLAEVFRKTADTAPRPASHAKPGIALPPMGKSMKPLSQRIEDAQSNLVALKDQLTAIVNASEEPDEAAQAQIGELKLQIEAQTKSLDALKDAESGLAVRTAPPADKKAPTIIVQQRKCEPVDHLIRAMSVHFLARVQQRTIEDVLRERYPSDEGTGVILRAAVLPAQTTVAGWAAELVQTAIGDFLNQLPRSAIYPVISGKGPKFTFGRNGAIKVPARAATPKINGSFVGEGQPIPVRKLGLSAITLTPKKMAVISEFTREMGLHSTPAIEGVIRQAMNEDTAEAIDTVLIDNVAADTIRPAGLRNGVGAIAASAAATTFDKIVADLKALMAPIIAARGGRDLVLLCNPAQELGLAWAVAPNGTFIFADGDAPQMRRLTIVASTTVAAGDLIMVDAADFASVTGDAPEFDVSDVATIHEEDTTPLAIGTPGAPATVAAPVRSLWQTASIGVRMLLDMNWAMRRTGMVSHMTGVTW